MNALEILIKEADDKVSQLKDYLAEGKANSYEEYQRLCGEIRGLLTMRGRTLDLKDHLERTDE